MFPLGVSNDHFKSFKIVFFISFIKHGQKIETNIFIDFQRLN